MSINPLTEKQLAFAKEYLVDLNATQAAIRAGYAKNSAKVIGSQNLTKLNIQVAIKKAMEKRSERTEVTADMVVNELAFTGFIDIRKIFTPAGNLIPPHELDDDVARAIKSIEVVVRQTGEIDEDGEREVEYVHKYVFHDKIKALELLGRHLAMFNQQANKVGNVFITMDYGNGTVKRIENGIVIEGTVEH